MRVIPKPNISPIRTYVRCYSSFRAATRTKFRNIAGYIYQQSMNYEQEAINKNLYTFPVHSSVQGIASKSDMCNLYDQKMVAHETGRKIYDKLMMLAPLNKCPFCGIGQVSTLDHYLPKKKFPTFAVLPFNLVPCCKDCNTGKRNSYARSINKQTFHPYFDNYTIDQWLFARVKNTSPVSIEYYVNPPASWSTIDKDRVSSHFNNYGLAKMYAIESSSRLIDLRDEFVLFSSSQADIVTELEKHYQVKRRQQLNSWETAMYQALYLDQWYCNGGYNN